MVDSNQKVHTPISKEKFNQVCTRISNSSEGIVKICKSLGISNNSVDDYIDIVGAEAEQQYARAKDDQLRIIACELLEIADAPVEAGDSAAVNNKRLQVDTRKWLLAKLKPKIYGDSVTVNDPNKALPTVLKIELVQPKAQQQIDTDKQDISDVSVVSD